MPTLPDYTTQSGNTYKGNIDENVALNAPIKGADLTAANPLVIGTDGNYFVVTGNTNFAGMTVAADRNFTLAFTGTPTITVGSGITLNNAGSNYTMAAGDIIECQSTAADTVTGRIIKADGTAVVAALGWPLSDIGYEPNIYYLPDGVLLANTVDESIQSYQRLYLSPIIIRKTETFTRIGCRVTTLGSAGAVGRIGLYSSDANGVPTTLITDYGTIDTTSTGEKEIVISETLSPGYYFMALVNQVQSSVDARYASCGAKISNNEAGGKVLLGTSTAHIGLQGSHSQDAVTGALPGTLSLTGRSGPADTGALWLRVV